MRGVHVRRSPALVSALQAVLSQKLLAAFSQRGLSRVKSRRQAGHAVGSMTPQTSLSDEVVSQPRCALCAHLLLAAQRLPRSKAIVVVGRVASSDEEPQI